MSENYSQNTEPSYFSRPDSGFPQYQVPPPEKPAKKGGVPRPLFFLFGFLAGSFAALMLVLGFRLITSMFKGGSGSGIVGPSVSSGGAVEQSTLDKLNRIDGIIQDRFLFDKDVDTQSGILKGYMDSYGDPYTVYYTKEEYQALNESMQGAFSGIGVVVQKDEATGYLRVVNPYTNSPAYAAGIREGDLISKVEGEDIAPMDLDIAVSKIRGPEGSSVKLSVLRTSTGEEFDVTIERQRITVESISHEMLPDGIGYIKMDSFDEPTHDQYMEAFNDLKAQGMKALIVDIRNNGGGLLSSVTAILDEMLPEGVITYTETADGAKEYLRSDASCVLDVPMAVLVNGYSASASEIFTGALQDYGAAEIVGTQTFGKGIVQSIIGLSDGSAIKLTTSRYYTPNGVCIHGVGITPDYVVEQPADSEEDLQLQKAQEILLEKIR